MTRLSVCEKKRSAVPCGSDTYGTLSVKLTVCLSDPLVAVTTTGYLPGGVPGSGVGLLLLPPPPQAERVRSPATISDSSVLTRRRLDGTPSNSMPAKASPLVAAHQLGPGRFSRLNIAVAGALVVIVRVVVPLPGSEAGLKLQALSDGKPEQDAPLNWIPPAKPFTAVTVRVSVPDPPTLGTVTKVAPSVKMKSPAVGEVDVT